MIRLSREIRFSLTDLDDLKQQLANPGQKNSWAAWPITNRIVPQLTLSAIVEGQPDPVTGYLCNVALIDDALRSFVNKTLIPTLANIPLNQMPTAEHCLRLAAVDLRDRKIQNASVASITLNLSPYLSYRVDGEDFTMFQLTHQFEFSAAHRLHCDSMTEQENADLFGKCNNPAGHGHNYVVEVSVSRELSTQSNNTAAIISLGQLAEIVNRNVIDPLDHKNLSEDIEHFSNVNPSVENICRAVFDWLKSDIESTGCQLSEVKIFETPKTWASFRG